MRTTTCGTAQRSHKLAAWLFPPSRSLNNNVIRMGPLTLVTVDSGYSAVTEDNGAQQILAGGNTYLLTHRNWKFQKFVAPRAAGRRG